MSTLLIAGLGNPGANYRNTRHNVGFMVVDELASLFDISLNKKKYNSYVGKGKIEGRNVVLLKPQTFMNLSGKAVLGALSGEKVQPNDVLAIFDDVELSAGNIRFRDSGGHGGHNGARSIIQNIGKDFSRLKIGIGRQKGTGDLSSHVLGGFSKDESKLLAEQIHDSVEGLRVFIKEGINAAQSLYNKKNN